MKRGRLAAYENVRGQIGCCGIWCGSCAVGNGSIRLQSTKLQEVLDSHGFEHWAPEGYDHGEFTRSLDLIRKAATCAGCRKDGGRDDCQLRACSQEKGERDCVECGEGSRCSNSELLETMRTGAEAAGLDVKRASSEDSPLLSGWETALRSKWPSGLLFLEDE